MECPPNAHNMMQSMRSIGYDFKSAIADIIDNSIAAGAKQISLKTNILETKATLAIADDGCGMSKNGLISAMTLGSKNPLESRNPTDLGRFGMGLKTASFSLCKRLTVASHRNGEFACMQWDLDHIAKVNQWDLMELTEEKLRDTFPIIDNEFCANSGSGTIVILDNFDTVETIAFRDIFTAHLAETRDHLGLTFHRFLDEDHVSITINGRKIESADPFFLRTKTVAMEKADSIRRFEKQTVSVKPYQLPHLSKLAKEDQNRRNEIHKDNQGFYIYRNKRLLVYGTWFRLKEKLEQTKLARVRVDFPSGLDKVWSVDIKKNRLILPEAIKGFLKQSIEDVYGASEKAQTFGTRNATVENDATQAWKLTTDREGTRYFTVNREAPVLQILESKLSPECRKLLSLALDAIEHTLPVEDIYAEKCKNNNPTCSDLSFDDAYKNIIDTLQFFKEEEGTNILNVILGTSRYYEHADKIREKIQSEIKNAIKKV